MFRPEPKWVPTTQTRISFSNTMESHNAWSRHYGVFLVWLLSGVLAAWNAILQKLATEALAGNIALLWLPDVGTRGGKTPNQGLPCTATKNKASCGLEFLK